MPRTNQDGKDIRLVLIWLCRKLLSEEDLAYALDKAPTTYARRKEQDDFPTFEELETFARHFDLSAPALQVAFGYLDLNMVLLDEEGLRQYVEQGGGVTPSHPFPTRGGTPTMTHIDLPAAKTRRRLRPDAPPGL